MEAVAALLKSFMGLALVHFQKYWLLMWGSLDIYSIRAFVGWPGLCWGSLWTCWGSFGVVWIHLFAIIAFFLLFVLFCCGSKLLFWIMGYTRIRSWCKIRRFKLAKRKKKFAAKLCGSVWFWKPQWYNWSITRDWVNTA